MRVRASLILCSRVNEVAQLRVVLHLKDPPSSTPPACALSSWAWYTPCGLRCLDA